MADENPTILYDADGILAVDKPAGYETVALGGGKCLTRALRERLGDEGIEAAHRLDRDTTGAQLFARTPAALKALTELFRHRQTTKLYLALCAGVPANPEGVISRNLSKWIGGHRPVQVVKGGGGLPASTEYRVLAANREFPASFILFHPREGRTHQIRVHAAAFGRPILGDDQYGDREANRRGKALCGLKRQALHAWRITLPGLGPGGGALAVVAPVHPDMGKALDALFPAWQAALAAVAPEA